MVAKKLVQNFAYCVITDQQPSGKRWALNGNQNLPVTIVLRSIDKGVQKPFIGYLHTFLMLFLQIV